MLAELVPPAVVTAEMITDPPNVELFPEELATIARAVTKRRDEFATVRLCARRALAGLGLPPAPLLPGERGAPIWPAGVVGSMTHCAGYRAAAVARAAQIRTIGIDAEPNEPLPAGVLEAVFRPTEQAHVRDLADAVADVHWDRLLFSAKESVYKAWFPLTRSWLDFDEAELTVDLTASTFEARILRPATCVDGRELTGFRGRWLVAGGLVATAVVEPDPTVRQPATGVLP